MYPVVGVCVAERTLISLGSVVSFSHEVCLLVLQVSGAICKGVGVVCVAVGAGEVRVGAAMTTFAGGDSTGMVINSLRKCAEPACGCFCCTL